MGKRGYPAICMTQHSARVFCQWLSAKTGRYYRLPTEASGNMPVAPARRPAYSFGDDPSQLGEYAWYLDNSSEKYQKVGQKKANPWASMTCTATWPNGASTSTRPTSTPNAKEQGIVKDPLAIPLKEYKRVVRGGSWDDGVRRTRSAARVASSIDWEAARPATPAEHLVLHRRPCSSLPHRPTAGLNIRRPKSRQVGQVRAAQVDKDKSKKRGTLIGASLR